MYGHAHKAADRISEKCGLRTDSADDTGPLWTLEDTTIVEFTITGIHCNSDFNIIPVIAEILKTGATCRAWLSA